MPADLDVSGALDAPDIRVVELVEERDVVAPFGAKPGSVVPVLTTSAAIASAVRVATEPPGQPPPDPLPDGGRQLSARLPGRHPPT